MTGAGKGLMMSEINALNASRNKKVLNIMRRRELIFQTESNYKKYHDLNSSVIMGNIKKIDPDKSIQIASIDTLQRRYKKGILDFLLECDTIIVDEAHDTTSNSYRDFLKWLESNGKKKFFIGFTATPFQIGNRSHDWWDSCIKPIEPTELRDQGFLVSDKIYAPKKIDLSKLKKAQGDYDNSQLFDVMSEMSIIGDVVKGYKEYGKNKPAILFAVNIKHSIMMAEAFRREGIPAGHYDQKHSSEERRKGILALKTGEIKILCNVNIFSTGVDIPWAEVGILARPTMSEVLDLQQRGRILRPYKICGKCGIEYGGEKTCPVCNSDHLKYEKREAIFIDHANNTDRHGLTYSVRQPAMEKKKKRKSFSVGQEINIKQCPECFLYNLRTIQECEGCGYEFKVKERAIKEEDGELVLIDEQTYRSKLKEKIEIRWSYHQKAMRFNSIVHSDYPYEKIFKDFGVEVFDYIAFPASLKKELHTKLLTENSKKVFK